MSTCAVCNSSNIQCWRCERISLKFKIATLQNELSKFYSHDVEKLAVEHYEKQISQNYYTAYSDVPMNYQYKNELSTSHFVTITFDPARFGMQPYDSERKDYIIHKLYRLFDKNLVKKCYGSFERHKNGIIHSHLIINAQQEDIKKIKQLLKSYFTDNPYNKIVVDIGPAKYPQAKDYIEKESEEYYYIAPSQPFTVGKKSLFSPKYTETDSDNPLDYGL